MRLELTTYWLKAYYFTTKLYPHIQTGAHYWLYMQRPAWCQSWTDAMCFCLEGLSGIEPELTESKSVVLPLYDSPTKSRIVKEQGEILSHVDIFVNPLKQKTLDFIEGFGKYTLLLLSLTCQNPQYHSQWHIQTVSVSLSSCRLLTVDVFSSQLRIYRVS